jgi:steroid 5-alpha reductase family enzyme
VDTYLIYGIISATVITVLLRYVSGVPMLEKAKEGNAAYEQYKKETPVFVPFLKSGKKITN